MTSVRTFFLLACAMAGAVVLMFSLGGYVVAPLSFLLPVAGFILVPMLAFKLTHGLDVGQLKQVLWASLAGALLGVVLGSARSSDAQGGLLALLTGPAGWLLGALVALAWLRRS